MGNVCKPPAVGPSSATSVAKTGTDAQKAGTRNGGAGKRKSVEWFDDVVDDGGSPDLQRLSQRGGISGSTGSATSASSGGGKGSSRSGHSSLHNEMTRTRKNRDVYRYYEVVEVLGVGSMGSVSLVRKRKEHLGGSARKPINQQGTVRSFLFGLLPAPGKGPSPPSSELSKAESFGTSSVHSVPSNRNYEMKYALKSIHLQKISDPKLLQELRNEVEILRNLDHPNIVNLIETFEYRKKLCLVMELCSGGDLYTRDPYTEKQARKIAGDLLSAVAYMHRCGIMHRDIKYENIMFENTSPNAVIKLVDFGLSKQLSEEAPYVYDGVGTIYTMAPQVLEGVYTSQADLWSSGVVIYMLLSSQMPFYGKKRSHVLAKIMKSRFHMSEKYWGRISNEAKELVCALLTLDPEVRPTAEEALQFPWFAKRDGENSRGTLEPSASDLDRVIRRGLEASLRKYAKYSRIKKLALMVVAHKSTAEEIGTLRDLFQEYDLNRNGTISYAEFCAILGDRGYAEDALRDMFKSVDLDGSGDVDYTEFLAATLEANGVIIEERLAEAFDRLDSDDSGYISKENLISLLVDGFEGRALSDSLIKEIIDESDVDKDRKVSYDDFLTLWDNNGEDEHSVLRSSLRQSLTRLPLRALESASSEYSVGDSSERSI